MWCKKCKRESNYEKCEICGSDTEKEIPQEIYWCDSCKVPIIKNANENKIDICPKCNSNMTYMTTDMRPVFPEERLLIELLFAKPFEYKNKSVWASNNRYFIDGKVKTISTKVYENVDFEKIRDDLEKYSKQNDYLFFDKNIEKFIYANSLRLKYLTEEAFQFIKESAKKFSEESIVISFSGGKDSTVSADLTIRALSNPSLVYIFGDTTLEFPLTYEYVNRFRENNPRAIFKTAKNKDQDFYSVCEDIGPPARMLRWCCSMFKTGPITRVLNSFYKDKDIITFYGIRKCESISRSKYNRIEDSSDAIKIQKQTVASPIFNWIDLDIWLYIFTEKVDFNDAYRLGYDRVGCWCCPNNNLRAQFLSKIYMPEHSNKWREFLVSFARRIGKPDPEVYVDTGKWKARQGGNGLESSEDVKIKFKNCTAEENAKIYEVNQDVDDSFYNLFIPFGRLAPELGRKIINEMIILDLKTNIPIISIQPFSESEYKNSVKIVTMNVKKHDDLQRMISYQVRKFNACRKCLKCESLCKYGAITINSEGYFINENKCRRCKACVNQKYLTGGCLMNKYLFTKN